MSSYKVYLCALAHSLPLPHINRQAQKDKQWSCWPTFKFLSLKMRPVMWHGGKAPLTNQEWLHMWLLEFPNTRRTLCLPLPSRVRSTATEAAGPAEPGRRASGTQHPSSGPPAGQTRWPPRAHRQRHSEKNPYCCATQLSGYDIPLPSLSGVLRTFMKAVYRGPACPFRCVSS